MSEHIMGRKATDIITGLTGVITAKAEFLRAPPEWGLVPDRLHDGEPGKSIWVDEPQLKLGNQVVTANPVEPVVPLGAEVKDELTGFRGTATARFIYLNGCIRVQIAPKVGKDGKFRESQVFDEQQIKVLRAPKVPKQDDLSKKEIERRVARVKPGGPHDAPTARSTPSARAER